jgi:hypothetical protein
MVTSPKGLGPKMTALTRGSSIYKIQTHPLVREDASQNKTLTVKE